MQLLIRAISSEVQSLECATGKVKTCRLRRLGAFSAGNFRELERKIVFFYACTQCIIVPAFSKINYCNFRFFGLQRFSEANMSEFSAKTNSVAIKLIEYWQIVVTQIQVNTRRTGKSLAWNYRAQQSHHVFVVNCFLNEATHRGAQIFLIINSLAPVTSSFLIILLILNDQDA